MTLIKKRIVMQVWNRERKTGKYKKHKNTETLILSGKGSNKICLVFKFRY